MDSCSVTIIVCLLHLLILSLSHLDTYSTNFFNFPVRVNLETQTHFRFGEGRERNVLISSILSSYGGGLSFQTNQWPYIPTIQTCPCCFTNRWLCAPLPKQSFDTVTNHHTLVLGLLLVSYCVTASQQFWSALTILTQRGLIIMLSYPVIKTR